jgi:hypothetical protein
MGQMWQEIKTLLNAQSISPGSTVYSDVLAAFNSWITPADFSLPVLLKTTGATGAFTITQQCSVDNVSWQDPTNSTAVAQAVAMTGRTTSTATWLVYAAVPSPYIRFKVVSTPAATVSLYVVLFGDRA